MKLPLQTLNQWLVEWRDEEITTSRFCELINEWADKRFEECLPEKKEVCEDDWHGMARLTTHKKSVLSRSCPSCGSIYSQRENEDNAIYNQAIDEIRERWKGEK